MAVSSLRTILSPVLNFITDFINNKNNPTNVTASQAGTYSKTELDNLLAQKMNYSDIPIAYWGQSLDFPVNLAVSGGNLTIGAGIPALLAGVRQVLPATTLPLVAPAGAPNYLYLTVVNGVLTYILQASASAESSTLMYLATMTNTGITDYSPVIQIGGKRLSNKKRGNAIPVSDSAGNIAW